MKIFDKRPLFTSLMLFLLIYVCSFFLPANFKLIFLGILLIIGIAITVLFILLKRKDKYTPFLIELCIIFSIIAVLLSYLFFDVKQSKFSKLSGSEVVIEALVISEAYDGGNICGYNIEVTHLNGEKNFHKAFLECEYNSVLTPGDKFTAQVQAEKLLDQEYGRFNEKQAKLSQGIFVTYVSHDENKVILTDENVKDIRIFFAKINTSLTNILRNNINGEAGNFTSAILLGNRGLISDVTARDFSRAGVSHILALSGMHLSVIMGALMFILKKLGINRKAIAIILSLIALMYMGITGFSLSVVRAIIMILAVYLSTLSFDAADSLTSLSIAAFIIILSSPGAILDAGFWMSFSATLGILVYMPSYNKFINNLLIPTGNCKRLLKPLVSILSALVAGLFATIPLIIVMCIFIREMSWWSILSSAILSIPTEAIIILSLLFLPLHKVPYLSWLLTKAISEICNLMFSYCAWVSNTEKAVVSLNYSFALIAAAIMGVALLYSFVFKSRNMIMSLTPFIMSVFVFFGSIFAYEYYHKDSVKITYLNCSSISDVIVVSNQGEAVICDLSRGSINGFNKALDAVYESRAAEIQAVMLTRYSNSQPFTLSKLFGRKMVRELWLPYPTSESDYNKLFPILEIAKRYSVEVKIYKDNNTLIAFESVNIRKISGEISRSQTPLTILTINTNKDRVTYIPPAFNECEEIYMHSQLFLTKSQHVIFGDTGPKTKLCYSLPQSNNINVIVLSDETRAAYIDPNCINEKLVFMAPELFEIYIEK